jgi:ubiquinone/menaquinone biosynthesis C-methylase UbiE
MTITDFIRARTAETYPEPETEHHNGITEEMAALAAAMLPPGARVLDIGCGQGPALKWFNEHGFTAHGITSNAADTAACRDAGYMVTMADMHEIPEGWTDSADCVWARHVLEHSPIPLFVIHEFRRILKPGGLLYVEVPAPDTSAKHETNPNHYSVLGFSAWLSLITRAGFEIVSAYDRSLSLQCGTDTYWSIFAKRKTQTS